MRCICLVADDNFAPHVGALLGSIAENSTPIPIYLIYAGLADENRDKLARVAEQNELELNFIDASGVDLSDFERWGIWSKTVWLKLFVGELLPVECERALYLDGDTIVLGDLKPLLNIDLGDAMFAAVPDTASLLSDRFEMLNIPPDRHYANTGVMVIDLGVWRRDRVGDELKAFARANMHDRDLVKLVDQCVINAVCWPRLKPIDYKWNCMGSLYDLSDEYGIDDVRVLHFAGPKPWLVPLTAGAEFYEHYAARSPWASSAGNSTGSRLQAVWSFFRDRIERGRLITLSACGLERYRKKLRTARSRAKHRNRFAMLYRQRSEPG